MPDMFDDPELAELLKEAATGEEELKLPRGPAPSRASVEYARDLIEKLSYDEDDYDFDTMSQKEVSELIEELKDEWEAR